MDSNDHDSLVHASSTTLSVSPHVPGIPQQSIWEEHRSMFIQLYVTEKKTLREVKVIAEKNFGFPQTPLSTYESKFRNELGLKKKLKWFDWIAIHDHISHLGAPKVEVLLDGNLIPPKKVKKEINRNLKKREGCNTTKGASKLPEGVEIRPVSQVIKTYDCRKVAINHGVQQPSKIDASLTMQPFSIDIQHPSGFPSHSRIVSNQLGICSALDPLLVDDFFGSSEMSMEVAESLFFSTAKAVSHITTRLPDRFQKTYDFLSSRFTRNRSITGILVVDPEFRRLWSSKLDHLPIMRALIDPAAPHPYSQGGDRSWSSDEHCLIDVGASPPLHYPSSAEHCHQRLTWSVQEIDQVTAPPVDAALSTSRDVFQAINGVLYLFSNNPNEDEAFECVRELVAQTIPWSTVEAILKIPSRTIQSIWVLLADCAFKLYVRRLFNAVVGPASDHTEWLEQHGHTWLAQAAVLGSAALCRKLMELGISPNIAVDRILAFPDEDLQTRRGHDVRPWTTTGLQTPPSWYHQYHSHKSHPMSEYDDRREIELHTSPLVEAAVRGHIETVVVLVEGGADIEKRINGCTAVGHLLHSLFHNNVNLEARLQILQRILELGTKLDVPFYFAPRERDGCREASLYTIEDMSQDTIADMAWQTNCQEAIHLVQSYTKACLGRLTVHGILGAAGESAEELADLLQSFHAPTSAERLSVETAALMKAIDKPEVLLNMIKAGLNMFEPRDLVYINFGYGGLEYAQIESFVPRNIVLEKYLSLIVETPCPPFARQILQSLPSQAWPITPLTSVILGVCRTSDSLNLLLQTGVQLQKPFLILAFAQAARDDDHNAMTLLLGLLGDINYSLRTGPIHWNIVILAAMAAPFAGGRRRGIYLRRDPASIETLDWLIAHGADIPSCIRTLNSIQDSDRSIGFDIQRLEWLLAHNIRPQGKSLCGIFMDYVSLAYWCDIPLEITTSLFEPPKVSYLPLFEPCVAMIDQSGHSVIKDFALLYFIKVGAPLEFLRRLCDSGIDFNTPAKFCDSAEHPLSWHLFKCDHTSPDCKCLTPLQAAISVKRIDVVRYLLEKGANTDGGAQYNALQSACMLGPPSQGDLGTALSTKIEIVVCLLRNGADPGRTKAGSRAALRLTITTLCHTDHLQPGDRWLFLEQHLRLLEVLLDASVGTAGFDTILEDALSDVSHVVKDVEAHEAVTKLLLRYQAGIDKQTWRHAPYGDSLMEACYKSDIDRIKTLLDHGVNPNLSDSSVIFNSSPPSTPSAVLAAQGNIPLLLLLRAAGAELVRHDNSLECAASAGRLDTVAWLLKFEKREKEYARALLCVQQPERAAIRVLIEEHLCSIGSDLLEDGNWKHPLYHSAASGYASRITQKDLEADARYY